MKIISSYGAGQRTIQATISYHKVIAKMYY